MVRLRLDRNADPNVSTQNRWAPLMSASGLAHAVVVRLLRAAGVNPSAQDKDGDTAMKFAADRLFQSVFFARILTAYQSGQPYQ